MTSFLYFLLGFIVADVVIDIVFAFRIYRVFKNQSFRRWPGAGFWMMWKLPSITRSARTRLQTIHAAACLFPSDNKCATTMEFVETVRKFTDLRAKPEEKKP